MVGAWIEREREDEIGYLRRYYDKNRTDVVRKASGTIEEQTIGRCSGRYGKNKDSKIEEREDQECIVERAKPHNRTRLYNQKTYSTNGV